jgi:quinol monooxygenase YgiN
MKQASMKTRLSIIAHARAKRGAADRMIAEQIKLVEATRSAPGCERYELHVSTEDPDRVTFVEIWESEALWRSHMQSPAIQQFRQTAGHLIEEFELMQLRQVA